MRDRVVEGASAEQVDGPETGRFQPLGQDAAMAPFRIALETEETGGRPRGELAQGIEGETAIGRIEDLLAVDPAHQRRIMGAGGLPPGLGRAEFTRMRISETRLLQARLQGVLREASLARIRYRANVGQGRDAGILQDRYEALGIEPFVADGEQNLLQSPLPSKCQTGS